MVFQHSLGWNWDFNVYSMNGEYFFHSGNYVEWQRPVLIPSVLGLLQFIFSRSISEYFFVILSNLTFYLSAYRAAKSLDFDFEVFYVFLMSPMAIFIGNFHGSEMLSLAFVMLFFSELYTRRSGLWASLGFLTRNTNFILFPFLLVDKDWKRVLQKGVLASLPIGLWLLANWVAMGDPLSAAANRIAVNFYENPYNFPVKPLAFLKIPGLSLLVIGAYLASKKPNLSFDKLGRLDLMLLAYSGYVVLKYLAVDLRQTRFLYPLVFTSAFFAVKSFRRLDLSRHFLTGFMVFNLVFAGFLVVNTPVSKPDGFQRAVDYIDGCKTESDVWPQLAYAGGPAVKPLEPELTAERVSNGWRAVFFNPEEHFKNTSVDESLPVIEENPSYVVYGTGECIEYQAMNLTYLDIKKELDEFEGRSGEYQPTYYLVNKFLGIDGRGIAEKLGLDRFLS
jgi:hypothetical protein